MVARGYGVLMPHHSNIALNIDESESELMFRDIPIASGTSYACAQVAAYALKIFLCYPDWDPSAQSAVKSALVTTASSFAARCIPGNEFAFGAGSVDIEKALDPGLVYEESSYHFDEYVAQRLTIQELNLPTSSFGYSHVACEQIFKRELKNVNKRDVSYKCVVEIFDSSLDPDVKIEAIPDFLQFRPGEKQKFNLHVKFLPHRGPEAQVSAMIKWLPSTGG